MGPDPLTFLDVLKVIHTSPQRLQSNFIREHSQIVGRLASCGLITTEIPLTRGMFGHHWRLTLKGLRVVELGEDE